MASKSTTPNKSRPQGERVTDDHVDARSSLAARLKNYDNNIKGGVGTNGMAYKRPGSNKK